MADRDALVLLDFQNEIVHPEGALGRMGMAKAVAGPDGTLARASRLLAAARSASLPVMHVQVADRVGYPDADGAVPLSAMCIRLGCLVENSWGVDFFEGFAPRRAEPVVVKRGMSAFAGTDLDLLLRLTSVRTMILAGVAGSLVLEATARQGVDLGYRALIPGDASGSFTLQDHEFTLSNLARFSAITTTDEVVSLEHVDDGDRAGIPCVRSHDTTHLPTPRLTASQRTRRGYMPCRSAG